MSSRILIVAAHPDIREDLRSSVLKALASLEGETLPSKPEKSPLIVESHALDEARQNLEADGPDFDLVVTSLQIPRDRGAQRDDNLDLGLDLARAWASADNTTANVLIVTAYGASQSHMPRLLTELSGLRRVDLLIPEQNPEEVVANILRRRWASVEPGAAADEDEAGVDYPDVVVEIDLTGRLPSYVILLGSLIQAHGELIVSSKKLERLTTLSGLLKKESNWVPVMRIVGEELFDELLSKNHSFLGQLQEAARGRPDTVHYRFKLNRRTYQILFEAMVPRNEEAEDDPRDFWMLKTPLTRRLGPLGGARASVVDEPFPLCLPQDERQPLNCLIIEADVHSETPFEAAFFRNPPPQAPLPDHFPALWPPLRNVRNEAAWLSAKLSERSGKASNGAVSVGRVMRINPRTARELDPSATSFCQVLMDHLANDHWHLVHFAGHSWYEDGYVDPMTRRSGRGWLFFPPIRQGGKIEAVTAEQFAGLWRHRPEFVYLSSCHSSRDDVVFELGRSDIRAIVGFRWDIDDDQAFEYAREFYSGLLLRGDRVERAFLKARQKLFEESRTNKSWAAATLVLEA